MDKAGHQIAALQISIGRDIGELQRILRVAMPTSNIVTQTINDTIVLTGEVDSPEEAQRAEDIAQGFVKDVNSSGGAPAAGLVVNSLTIRGRDQVMLKVTVAEVQRNIAKQLGLTSSTWGLSRNLIPSASTATSQRRRPDSRAASRSTIRRTRCQRRYRHSSVMA